MTEQHRATESEWYCLKARTCGDKADQVAYSTIHELLNRIEALEREVAMTELRATNADARPTVKAPITRDRDETGDYIIIHDVSPSTSSLVKRVACAIYPDGSGDGFCEEARDAIREVAAWLREQYGPIVSQSAMRLEQEAER